LKETPKWLLESEKYDECYKTLMFLEEKAGHTNIYMPLNKVSSFTYRNDSKLTGEKNK
jgi:hypothetical protein